MIFGPGERDVNAISSPSDRLRCACRDQTGSIRWRAHDPERLRTFRARSRAKLPVARAPQRITMGSKLAAGLLGSLAFLTALPLAARADDERKVLAFETIDRNAEQMAAVSDSVFFFGEPGMQEFESTKLLK